MTNTTRFYSRQVAQSLKTPHNIISIGEAGDGCQLNSCHTNVLRLLFQDIQEFIEEKYILFSSDHAYLILNWLLSIPKDSLVIVHCEAGIARSAAVVKFMIDKLGYELDTDHFCEGDYSLMNTYVYNKLVEQYQLTNKLN